MTQANRPSTDSVAKMVMSLFTSRRYKDFILAKVEYVFFPSAYNFVIRWDGREMTLKIPAELVEDALSTRDTFKERKIKKMIKDAFGDDNDE